MDDLVTFLSQSITEISILGEEVWSRDSLTSLEHLSSTDDFSNPAQRSMSEAAEQRLGAVTPVSDTQFDPSELIGTQIPFTDPFAFDDNDFRASYYTSGSNTGFTRSALTDLASSLGRAEIIPAASQEAQHTSAALIHLPSLEVEFTCTPSFPPAGPVVPTVCVYPKPKTVTGKTRVRLTPVQAINIYRMKRTKSVGTASRLATRYGISPKAIRDIWTRKSWAQDTLPHWNE